MQRLLVLLLFLTLVILPISSCGQSTKSITAPSWIVTDVNGKMLAGQSPDTVRPIASITKLMTVMAVLDRGIDLEHSITIKRIKGISTSIPSRIQDQTRLELIELALVKSDNLAAYLLCANFNGQGFDPDLPCVSHMNIKAISLGLKNTVFVDPTGLYPGNISNGLDLVKLTLAAATYPVIVNSSDKESIHFNSRNIKKTVHNTNPLVSKYHNFVVSKTGWIKSSGGCITAFIMTDQGPRVIVLLGSKSTKSRIEEVEIIVRQIDREDQDLLYRAFGIEREN